MKKINILVIAALAFVILSNATLSQPVPYSVDGYIFELEDGATQVAAGTKFSITNVNTGFYIEGVTGRGSNTGKYASVIKGSNGNSILIKSWNLAHETTRTITLSGVIHGVNLYLNTTMPQMPPDITSQPVTEAIEDAQYSYQVIAEDPNGDPIYYSLNNAPAGMSIENNGLITWTPENSQTGTQYVIVNASDGILDDLQPFSINVIPVNDAPKIISGPIITARQDTEYNYDMIAEDIDSSQLNYSLETKPEGMEINSSGTIKWIPTNDNIGDNPVKVIVSDGELSDNQKFYITVENVNDAPYITSYPLTVATEDEIYIYNIAAADPDNDSLTYHLGSAPENMLIDSTTGILKWTPQNEDVGTNEITVSAFDGELIGIQIFNLTVINTNDAPYFTTEPVINVTARSTYYYDANATDPDNDEIIFKLVKAPEGINPKDIELNSSTGILKWEPKNKDEGIHEIVLEATDKNLSSYQSFNITVFKKNEDNGNSGGGNGGGRRKKEFLLEHRGIIKYLLVRLLSEADSLDISVDEMTNRPQDAKRLTKLVYRYFKITKNSAEGIESATLSFEIPHNWLADRGLKPENIALFHYDGNWRETNTRYIGPSGNFDQFTADVDSFSFFAIASKEDVDIGTIKQEEPKSSIIKKPIIITGAIYRPDGLTLVPYGTPVAIMNLNTSKSEGIVTGDGPYSGRFSFVAEADIGDTIALSSNGKMERILVRNGEESVEIKTETEAKPLSQRSQRRITGFATAISNEKTSSRAAFFALGLISLAIMLFSAYKIQASARISKNAKKTKR